jgi:NAD(P)H-hydrate epimerase
MKILSVEEMRRVEAASDEAGHSYAAMMELAGRAVAEVIAAQRDLREQRALVLVGPGNNGGDGLVAARHLAAAGAHVTCYLLKPRNPARDENFRLVQEGSSHVALAGEDEEWQELRRLAEKADIVVDALLGTGTRLPLRGAVAEILLQVSQALATRRQRTHQAVTPLITSPAELNRPLVVAVDGPSGLDYDTGALDQAAIPADLTVTFAYPKRGHMRLPGAGALGELLVADIGTDPALAADVVLDAVTAEMVRGWLPVHSIDVPADTLSKALIVAGSVNCTGAPYFAGAAATRAGVDLVTLALPAAIQASVSARLAEATYLMLHHELGVIAAEAAPVLAEQAGAYDALLLGPGLGQERETAQFIDALLGGTGQRRRIGFVGTEDRAIAVPPLPSLIVDADGLSVLGGLEDWPQRLPPGTVLTPHPAEMAQLMGCSIQEVQADRTVAAQSQAENWGQVVVLQGAHTVVAAPDGRTAIEPFAIPGLAKTGTRDVLAGTIVALRAQGLDAFEAAVAGGFLHGLAGRLAYEEVGAAGMTASDLLAHLPRAWRQVTED